MPTSVFLIDLSEDELRARDEEHADLRLVSIAMYGLPTSPQFAAIWLSDAGVTPRTILVSELLSDVGPTPLTLPPALRPPGNRSHFYPVLISATGAVGKGAPEGLRLVMISEEREVDPRPFFYFGTNVKMPFRPANPTKQPKPPLDTPVSTDTCLFTKNGEISAGHFGLFHQTRGSSATRWNRLALDPVEDIPAGLGLSAQHDAVLRGWSRAHHAVPHPAKAPAMVGGTHGRQMFVHYRDDTFEPWPDEMLAEFDCGTRIDGPLRHGQIKAVTDLRAGEGRWPIAVGANGRGDDLRFAVTFAHLGKLRPLQRHFVARDGLGGLAVDRIAPSSLVEPVPGSASTLTPVQTFLPSSSVEAVIHAFDQYVLAKFRAEGSHATQVAIAKNGRLKFMRSYTWGEPNYPVTHHRHKFRFWSVAKFLLGLRIAALGDPAFLDMSLPEALAISDSEIEGNPDSQSLYYFHQTRVRDLLDHATGWKRENAPYPYKSRYFQDGRQKLPLQPGDFRKFVMGSGLDFVGTAPGAIETYNNANFVAAAEALSQRVKQRVDGCDELMQDWWEPSIGRSAAIVIPGTQADCLDRHEVVRRSTPGMGLPTVVSASLVPASVAATFVPAAYTGGRDYEMLSSGNYTMSAVAMARILQGMHPTPPSPATRLLTWSQVQSLKQHDPDVFTPSKGGPTQTSYGAGSASVDFAGNQAWRLAKDGSLGDNYAVVDHYFWEHAAKEDISRGRHPGKLVSSVSACAVSTGGFNGQKLTDFAERLESLGYLDGDDDLFPDLL